MLTIISLTIVIMSIDCIVMRAIVPLTSLSYINREGTCRCQNLFHLSHSTTFHNVTLLLHTSTTIVILDLLWPLLVLLHHLRGLVPVVPSKISPFLHFQPASTSLKAIMDPNVSLVS